MNGKTLALFIIAFRISGLFAQSNSKTIGQFAWAPSVQDSVSIDELPFIESNVIQIPDNAEKPIFTKQSYIIIPGLDKAKQSKIEQTQSYDYLNDLNYIIRDAHPINDVIDVNHDIK